MRIRILPFPLMRIRILSYKQRLKTLKKAHIPYILASHLQIDADLNPDPAYHIDEDPHPTFQFDADPDPQHYTDVTNTSSLDLSTFSLCTGIHSE